MRFTKPLMVRQFSKSSEYFKPNQTWFRASYPKPITSSRILKSLATLICGLISGHWNDRTCVDPPTMNFFRLNCPLLQRLYLQGTLFYAELPLVDNICTLYFPSLLHIDVSMVHYVLAIRILEQCPQLRSFSAKLHVYPNDDDATVSSALLSTQIRMCLPNMKKLSLGGVQDYFNMCISKFIELLLPCCPNLRTYFCECTWYRNDRSLLDPYWWTLMLGSHNKLKHISLQLIVYGTLNALSMDAVSKFESLPFFVQFKVNVAYTIKRSEFPRMAHVYCIEN
ncbi:hypothetical protein I4U23_031417 [Adineta vaga]|nr:hypothetical protein I4U23_031417 [Adineta vaga]